MSDDKKKDGEFKVIKVTKLTDLKEGDVIEESDLCFQNEERIIQCEYIREEEEKEKKYEIKPGIYSITHKGNSIGLETLNMKQRRILESYDNSKRIMDEAKLFFSQKEVYDFLEKQMKRAILVYSPPGYGKTCAITKVCKQLFDEDPGTVVISWPTAELDARHVGRFLSSRSEYTKECTRLVFLIEDIGGGEIEDRGGARGIDSALLNLLDGVDVTFPLPTFIIATTNYPANLLDALADRPGRFDEFIELMPPNHEQRVLLTQFIAKRELTDDEVDALKKAENFSVAHLSEIVERSLLKSKSYREVIEEIVNHREAFSRHFEEAKAPMGIGVR